MRFKTLAFIIGILNIGFVQAQEGIPVYSDYFVDNLYLLHPSMAGGADYAKIRLTARQQWFDQDRAPNIQTLNFNARLNENSGIGTILFKDENGYHSQKGAYLTYAHHLLFSRSRADLNQLSFGLSAGLIQSQLDETQFDPRDFDPIIAGIVQSSSYVNVDVGMSYNFLNFSSHFTVKNLLFTNRRLYSEEFESNNQRSYLFSAAYFLTPRTIYWAFEPSFLVSYKERTGEGFFDANIKAYKNVGVARVWGGVSYRRSFDGAQYTNGVEVADQNLQYITPVVGFNYKKFLLAYTYSYQTGSVRFSNGGFHQITLGYNIFKGRVNNWEQDMRYNGMLRPRGY